MKEVFPEPIRNLPEAAIPIQGIKAYLSQSESHQIIFMEFEHDVDLPEHTHAAQVGIVLEGRIDLVIDGNTPNCIIYLDNLTLAKECTPQGWITITSDPNNDNIGLWIHHDETRLEWNVGDKLSIFYWLIAQDDPQIAIFDTKESANPYPSIFGTHNGTIKPKQTFTVSKLYTYPCVGTGGHTEYAKICNDSWSIETLPWKGYKGDWHNLSFPESFKLYANIDYNYTIKTGSYPQIHHNTSLLTTNGWINCIKFVDANGKEYDDWIPAIKLE